MVLQNILLNHHIFCKWSKKAFKQPISVGLVPSGQGVSCCCHRRIELILRLTGGCVNQFDRGSLISVMFRSFSVSNTTVLIENLFTLFSLRVNVPFFINSSARNFKSLSHFLLQPKIIVNFSRTTDIVTQRLDYLDIDCKTWKTI